MIYTATHTSFYPFWLEDAHTAWITTRGFTGHVQRNTVFESEVHQKQNVEPIPKTKGIGKHLDKFGLINANARMYEPLTGKFLAPDPFVQAPDYSQSFNRYAYCWNNPLRYTDPDGEFLIAAIIVGTIVGAYIGGAAAEGWEYNAGKWAWDGKTWAGIGLGAVIGGSAGVGFYYAAPALANTGFFAHFGASGTVAAYTVTGGVAGGLAGYGAGFSGGMLYSDGNWGYSHQSGIHGAKVGATVGSVIGAISGNIAAYEPPKALPPVKNPDKPKWEGQFFKGTEEEASQMLRESSMRWGVETAMWNTSSGFYFDPIRGNAYGIRGSDLNYESYRENTINTCYRYSYYKNDEWGPQIWIKNQFSYIGVNYRAHTHPYNSVPSGCVVCDYGKPYGDRYVSHLLGLRGVVFGWNKNVRWNYFGDTYW